MRSAGRCRAPSRIRSAASRFADASMRARSASNDSGVGVPPVAGGGAPAPGSSVKFISASIVIASPVSARLAAEALIVDVDGFEGPLDLLLTLSRTQKVDQYDVTNYTMAQRIDFAMTAFADDPNGLAGLRIGG